MWNSEVIWVLDIFHIAYSYTKWQAMYVQRFQWPSQFYPVSIASYVLVYSFIYPLICDSANEVTEYLIF